ncbi:hypothetical protein OB905_00035 [Halobacteria archaeon AArc-dxtr1]|nr:hypothetical protein [Halobacteria archaeon AArc-dxtr1]
MTSRTSPPPSVAVVQEVARREGVSPTELHPPLWNAVDSDALDRLVTGTDAPCVVEFSYRGYTVRVDYTDDDRVQISTRAESAG